MPFQYELWPRDFELARNECPKISDQIISRILILCKKSFLLTELRDGWFGLPGGKLNVNEVSQNINLMSRDGLHGVFRELEEETGEKLAHLSDEVKFLGLSETWKILNKNQVATLNTNIIWYLEVEPDAVEINRNVWADTEDIKRINIFPDAERAIEVILKPKLHHLRGGWIYPKKQYVFMDRKQPITTHSSPPEWLVKAWNADKISQS